MSNITNYAQNLFNNKDYNIERLNSFLNSNGKSIINGITTSFQTVVNSGKDALNSIFERASQACGSIKQGLNYLDSPWADRKVNEITVSSGIRTKEKKTQKAPTITQMISNFAKDHKKELMIVGALAITALAIYCLKSTNLKDNFCKNKTDCRLQEFNPVTSSTCPVPPSTCPVPPSTRPAMLPPVCDIFIGVQITN